MKPVLGQSFRICKDSETIMQTDPYRQEIIGWLAERGHTPREIRKITKRLDEYDDQVVRDTLFGSTNTGEFRIETIIQEALAQPDPRFNYLVVRLVAGLLVAGILLAWWFLGS